MGVLCPAFGHFLVIVNPIESEAAGRSAFDRMASWPSLQCRKTATCSSTRLLSLVPGPGPPLPSPRRCPRGHAEHAILKDTPPPPLSAPPRAPLMRAAAACGGDDSSLTTLGSVPPAHSPLGSSQGAWDPTEGFAQRGWGGLVTSMPLRASPILPQSCDYVA